MREAGIRSGPEPTPSPPVFCDHGLAGGNQAHKGGAKPHGRRESGKGEMIIPVRCFTCGKVSKRIVGEQQSINQHHHPSHHHHSLFALHRQVIGNKYETYTELLKAEWSEG